MDRSGHHGASMLQWSCTEYSILANNPPPPPAPQIPTTQRTLVACKQTNLRDVFVCVMGNGRTWLLKSILLCTACADGLLLPVQSVQAAKQSALSCAKILHIMQPAVQFLDYCVINMVCNVDMPGFIAGGCRISTQLSQCAPPFFRLGHS